jgi:uncharacterized protein
LFAPCGKAEEGISRMSEVIERIDEPVVAICMHRSYDDLSNRRDIYKCTRGTWRVSKHRADRAQYAFAVYHGLVLEVYEIDGWFDAGTTPDSFGPAPGRSEFVGRVAPDKVRNKYVGKRMPDRSWGQSVRYYNC